MRFYALLIALLFVSCNSQSTPQVPAYTFYTVERVVDGDTFWLNDGSKEGLKVRLIGIDAPESRNTGHKTIQPYGAEAKQYLKQRLSGQKVRLEYDVTRKDRYGRTLAYAYLPDGTFLNAEMMKEGYATTLTMPPNVKHADLFVKLQQQARKQRKGLWK